MPFKIDTDLIENDEVSISENPSNNLEITHVPTGDTLTVDKSATVSGLEYTDSDARAAVENFTGKIDLGGADRMNIPERSSDPSANPGDIWYRTDLD